MDWDQCAFPGCERKYTSKGLCSGHYKQRKRKQPLKPLLLTQKITGQSAQVKTCPACEKILSFDMFGKNRTSKDGLQWTCKSCCAQAARDRRTPTLLRVQELKTSLGCADCGYKEHAVALDFDHLPGSAKIKSVAALVSGNKSWDLIEAEIAKCEVVCANCHRVRTANRRKGETHDQG